MSEPVDVIELHLQHLREGRYSDATLAGRERVLRTIPEPVTIDRVGMKAWWKTRLERVDPKSKGGMKERAASSLSSEASHVRAFYRWAMSEGIVERNAADWLPVVRQKKPKPKPVPEGDLFKIMEDCPSPMRQMIALAAMAGLRAAEIARFEWEDIDRGNGILMVREGKGGKDRSIPLSSGLLAELGDPGKGLVVGKPMTASAVSIAVSRYMRSCGSNYTCHKLRARYLTRFLAATGDLIATAAVAGHEDVSTTARYTLASGDTMRRGAEAAGRIG